MRPKGINRPMHLLRKIALLTGLTVACSGCVFHSYDPKTGTERFWGLGYVKMRFAPEREGVRVLASRSTSAGLKVDLGPGEYGISLGYDKSEHMNIASNTVVRLEWQSGDFLGVRAGTNSPPY